MRLRLGQESSNSTWFLYKLRLLSPAQTVCSLLGLVEVVMSNVVIIYVVTWRHIGSL